MLAAGIIGLASFVFGLAGFGIGLVALSLLPFVMEPATAVPLITVYAVGFALVMLLDLRRDVVAPRLAELLLGTLLGAPAGVWVLATAPAGLLRRLIGLVLITAVMLELRGAYPRALVGRTWALLAGALAGLLGGAVGTPGPPVILYLAAQGLRPRAMKATLQAFFLVNQGLILGGYWWAGILTREVGASVALFALPAAGGAALGVRLFNRIDQARFRRVVFLLLLGLGAILLARG